MDTYRTIRREGQDEFVERRSRFIGAICPVISASFSARSDLFSSICLLRFCI